jgi:dipeptidyl aminopeptidase/acylaminoacyl peptidase
MKKSLLALTLLSVFVAGCGGGGSESSGSPSESNFTFGNLAGRAALTNPPLSTNSGAVIATSLTGNISALRLIDLQPTLQECRVLFGAKLISTATNLHSVNFDGTNLQNVALSGSSLTKPVVSPDGTKVAYDSTVAGDSEIIYLDLITGGAPVFLTANAVGDFAPQWSPDSQWIVFQNPTGIAKVNVATKAVTQLTTNPVGVLDQLPSWGKHGGNEWVYFSSNRDPDTFNHIYRVGVNGGAVTLFHSEASAHQLWPVFSPDGTTLMYNNDPSAGSNSLRTRPYAGVPITTVATDTPNDRAGWSPDGTMITFNKGERIFVANRNGSNPRELLPGIGAGFSSPSFLAPRTNVTLVGANPSVFSTQSIAGFIYTRSGANVRSCVGFRVTTPSSVVVTRQTLNDTTSPNLVYSIDADSVQNLIVAQSPLWSGNPVITTNAPANGALVDFDANTGQVVGIIPFNGTRAKPSIWQEGGSRIYRGTFTGVYDGSGKNLSPSGTSEVRIDIATGKITAA